MLGERGHPALSAYAASKGALNALVKSLAADLGTRGITVDAVSPGWFAVPMADGWIGDAKLEQKILSHTVLHRWGAGLRSAWGLSVPGIGRVLVRDGRNHQRRRRISGDMKAARWHGQGDVRVEVVDQPDELDPGDVLVEVDLTMICASDVAERRTGPHVIPLAKATHP